MHYTNGEKEIEQAYLVNGSLEGKNQREINCKPVCNDKLFLTRNNSDGNIVKNVLMK